MSHPDDNWDEDDEDSIIDVALAKLLDAFRLAILAGTAVFVLDWLFH